MKKQSVGRSSCLFFFPKTPYSHFHGCVKECCVVPLWTKVSERYISFHQSVKKNGCFLRSLSFFRCWRVRHVGSHSSQTDRPRCSTLQGQSLRCHLSRVISYEPLRYSTNKKLFQRHLVCHAFLSISFAFCGCSRSVQALNCG